MTLDTLLELTAIIIAVYALLPRTHRLDIRFRIGFLHVFLLTIGFLAPLFLLFYTPISKLTILPEWPDTSTIVAPDVAFIVVLIILIAVGVLLIRSNLTRRRIFKFRMLVEELLRTGDYWPLFDLIDRYLPHLVKISYSQFLLPRIKQWLANRSYKIAGSLGELSKPSAISSNGMPSIRRLYTKCLNLLKRIFKRFFHFLTGRVSQLLPDYSNTADAAREILRLIIFDHRCMESMIKIRPYLPLTMISQHIPFQDDLLKFYLCLLLRDPNSVLFYEIRNNLNRFKTRRYDISPNNKLISFFFADSTKAHDCGIWKPIGDEVLDLLDEVGREPDKDLYNLPMENFQQSSQWKSPIYLGIRFFDIMVSSALYQGVQSHMWLWYYLYFTERIIRNFKLLPNVDSEITEWPNKYCYLLYTMTSTLSDWVQAVDDLSSDNPHAKLERTNRFTDYGSIPKSSILVLSKMLKRVLLSSLPDSFQKYLSEIVFRLYFKLYEKRHLEPFGETLLNCLIGDELPGSIAFRHELIRHLDSFDKIPYEPTQFKIFEAALQGVE